MANASFGRDNAAHLDKGSARSSVLKSGLSNETCKRVIFTRSDKHKYQPSEALARTYVSKWSQGHAQPPTTQGEQSIDDGSRNHHKKQNIWHHTFASLKDTKRRSSWSS